MYCMCYLSAPRHITTEKFDDRHDVLRLPLSEQNYNKVKNFFLKETNYEKSITHSSHRHPLILVDAQCNDTKTMNENDALCNACLVSIIENMTFYKCKFNGQGCNFVLHECCTRLPSELKDYKGHPHHTLLLLPKAGDGFSRVSCDACHIWFNGFAYSCVQCSYKIDVWCAFIGVKIKHKSHPNHQLSSFYAYHTSGEHDSCRMCLSGFKDTNKTSFSCNFVLHECCTRLPAELKDYKGHPHHTLLLLPKAGDGFSRVSCDACHIWFNGFAYSCVQCSYKIDVWCAFIGVKIKHKSHPNHQLSSFYAYHTSGEHDSCRMCLSGFKDTNKTSFSCRPCGFHLHVGCALLLPETIRHRYDKHPMSLAYSPVENHEGDYFCEVCEEELNPNAWFYHCHGPYIQLVLR